MGQILLTSAWPASSCATRGWSCVPHPGFPHGAAYTKHAEVSLEEMAIDNVVVTDIPPAR